MKKAQSKIAIIGGGYTGLTAAYRLAQQGCHVTLYEKNAHVGGLVAGFTMHNQPIEQIYHFLYKTDMDMIALMEELDVRDRLTFHKSSVSTYYDGALYPFMTPKDLLAFTPLSLLSRVRTGIVALYLKFLTQWKPLASVTALQWMTKYAGAEAVKVIWEPLLKGKFGAYYNKVTMSWLWSRIRVRAHSQSDDASGEMLGYVKGGFRVVSDALARRIAAHGGVIHAGSVIERISGEANGLCTVHAGEQTDTFDAVIATTPTHVFAQLIKDNHTVTQKTLQQLESIDYIGAVVGVFSSEQEISPYYWHNINDAQIPFLVFLSQSALIGTPHVPGRHVYYIGVYVSHDHPYFTQDAESILQEWFAGIKTMFPDFDQSRIHEKHLFQYKNAQHIVDIGYEEKMPPYESVVPHVYLANFSQIFPDDRGINYAVQEGNNIAQLVSDHLKNNTQDIN